MSAKRKNAEDDDTPTARERKKQKAAEARVIAVQKPVLAQNTQNATAGPSVLNAADSTNFSPRANGVRTNQFHCRFTRSPFYD
jgi:hypothetical protein